MKSPNVIYYVSGDYVSTTVNSYNRINHARRSEASASLGIYSRAF